MERRRRWGIGAGFGGLRVVDVEGEGGGGTDVDDTASEFNADCNVMLGSEAPFTETICELDSVLSVTQLTIERERGRKEADARFARTAVANAYQLGYEVPWLRRHQVDGGASSWWLKRSWHESMDRFRVSRVCRNSLMLRVWWHGDGVRQVVRRRHF